jgi:hypothetical protein
MMSEGDDKWMLTHNGREGVASTARVPNPRADLLSTHGPSSTGAVSAVAAIGDGQDDSPGPGGP